MQATANKNEKMIVALELGSSRAKIGIAGFDPEDPRQQLTVYDILELPTVDSIRYGRIYNVREVTRIVDELVRGLEKKYSVEGRRILNTFVSIGGRSLKAVRLSARTVLPERVEITEDLIEQLQDSALESVSDDVDMVWLEPVSFSVDNIATPRPIGTKGTRLWGEFTAVTCNPANKTDIYDVLYDNINIGISGMPVRAVALAHLVLSPQETNAGCMLVDFGAETLTVSIYKNYALRYLATIPIGSRLITRDIAQMLALTDDEAEEVKKTMANALPDNDSGDRTQESVNAIVSARLADIVANIAAQPEFAGYKPENLAGGIILTGGGANLRNFARLLDSQTPYKVRLATLPPGINISDPSMAASDNLDIIALLNEAASMFNDATPECLSAKPEPKQQEETAVSDDIEIDRPGKSKENASQETQPYEGPFADTFTDNDYTDSIYGQYDDSPQFADGPDEDPHRGYDREDYRSYEDEDEPYAGKRRQRSKKHESDRNDRSRNDDDNGQAPLSKLERIRAKMARYLTGQGSDDSAEMS